MISVLRQRDGYLWTTADESERIRNLIRSSGIYKRIKSVSTKADFVRLSAICMGELLKNAKLNISQDSSEEDVIRNIVSYFQK